MIFPFSFLVDYKPNFLSVTGSQWHVSLDETSGNRNDSYGTISFTEINDLVGYTSDGKIGNAAYFNQYEYLSCEHNQSMLLGTEYSICGWVKLADKNESYTILSKYNSEYSLDLLLSYEPESADPEGWIKNTCEMDRIRVHGLSPETGSTPFLLWANSFGSPPTNSWIFIALRYRASDGRMTISVNNSGSDTIFHPIGTNFSGDAPTTLGCHGDGEQALHGALDEWSKFNYYLSDAQVSYLYNSGSGVPYPFTADVSISYIVEETEGLHVIWEEPNIPFSRVDVFRRTALETSSLLGSSNRGESRFVDRSVESGQTYFYSIQTVGVFGRGNLSPEVSGSVSGE